jgi:ubiquinone/menaquinone biosynthesis C-methylase UbiE
MRLPSVLENALYGHMVSHCMFSAAELGVFEQLAAGPRSCAELAKALGIEEKSLQRLVRGLEAAGILDRDGDCRSVRPELLPFLDPASDRYRGGLFPYFQKQTAKLFPHLTSAVRENQPQWSRIESQAEDGDAFASIYANPTRLRSFADCMWNLGWEDENELLGKLDLSARHRLVDVGGCAGSFAIAALRRFPNLHAVVFDRAEVKEVCYERRARFALEARLEFVAGNFFEDALPTGDLFSLGYILSDWTHEAGTELLRKIARTLEPGGELVVLEKLFDDDKRGPLPTAMMNLCMLLEQFGEHRTAGEYTEWLEQTGFSGARVVRSSGEKHAVVATKKAS